MKAIVYPTCELFLNLLLHAINASLGKGRVIIEFDKLDMSFDDLKNKKMFYGLNNGTYVRLKFLTKRSADAELNDIIDFEPIKGTLSVPNLCRTAEDLNGKLKIADTGYQETLWEWLLPCAVDEIHANEYTTSQILWLDLDKCSSLEIPEYLQKKGVKVLVAKDIQGALNLIEQNKLRIGAAFLDSTIPEVRQLRRLLSILHPSLKIAALKEKENTGLDTSYYDGVMVRPVNPRDLLEIVQQWLPIKA